MQPVKRQRHTLVSNFMRLIVLQCSVISIKKSLYISYLFVFFVITCSTVSHAGPVQEAYKVIGSYDYVEAAQGLRVGNNSASGTCDPSVNNSTGSLSVSLPSGQSVVKAFLYWGGSRSSADTSANLQVNGGSTAPIIATSHTSTFTGAAIPLPYYLSVADITSQLQGEGEDLTVNVSGMDTDGTTTYTQYCAAAAHMGIVVVHTTDIATSAPRAVFISHGLEWARNTSISNTYSNLPPTAAVPDAKAVIWAVEGDAGLSGSESLTFNGADQGITWSQGDSEAGRSLTFIGLPRALLREQTQ